ncbi:hypothetical protein [Winogradskyella sp. Asnod2-B02-A]|uniref:hypothetical protein n=1 Tax=Winogradskyella sp. Asnod2-B02-A TaxID=3160583 RepID=UPI00386DEF7F
MKGLRLVVITLLCTLTMYAQEAKKDSETVKTKMDVFASKTGIITKFTDYNLTGIKSSYGVKTETRIRKINSGDLEGYFYQIEKPGKYSKSTASIAYLDLVELIKALESLKVQEEADVIMNPDYLENKFVTEDGFQVGYYVSKGKSTWYLILEKYGSDKTLFLKDAEIIKASFIEAKEKIDGLSN